MMGPIETSFSERLAEVYDYLDFLDNLEEAAKAGPPRFEGAAKTLSPRQTHILRAGVFVQLYNLVEATMTWCLDALAAASSDGRWKAADLTPEFRKEWVKVVTASHKELNADNRIKNMMVLAELLIAASPLTEFKIEKGGGGNWNDSQIETVLERIGLRLRLTPTVRAAAKKKFRDNYGPLGLIVRLRNDLAHGAISFSECGQPETGTVLRDLTEKTAMYLRAVVRAVERFIHRHEFLAPEHRPAA